MRVLGIDPALAGATGYGVVESDGRNCRSVHFGALAAKRTARRSSSNGASRAASDPSGRLREIHTRVAALMDEFSPDAVAVESVFTALNMKTALALAEVRGVVLLAAAERNLPVHSYSPREVKSSVTGYGNAGKEQMQQMVRAQLGLAQAPQPADAADALAVALCHIHSSQAAARIASATAATVIAPGRGRSLDRPVSTRSAGASEDAPLQLGRPADKTVARLYTEPAARGRSASARETAARPPRIQPAR